jgi:hypothetical protein
VGWRYKREVRSEAQSVDEYLNEVPCDPAEEVWSIRDLSLRYLADHEEGMEYGMPVYRPDGRTQARYISLYVAREGVVAANAERLRGLRTGKGCLRLAPSEDLDVDLGHRGAEEHGSIAAGAC